MILKSVNGQLSSASFFKPVAVGYVLGAAVFFVPVLLLMALTGIVMVATGSTGGNEIDGSNPLPHLMMGFIMVPVILILQSMMFGGLVVLGLTIYRIKQPIQVSNRTETISELPAN